MLTPSSRHISHQVLPYVIDRLQAAGYRLVTLAECLGEAPYQSVGSPGTPDVSYGAIIVLKGH